MTKGRKSLIKKLPLLLLLLPLQIFGQCPEWVGSSIEKAETLKPLLQKHLSASLKEVADTSTQQVYRSKTYRSDLGDVLFKIGWYVKQGKGQGNKEVTLTPVVNDITIKGPADRIDRLFEELRAYAKTCSDYSVSERWVKFSRYIFLLDTAADQDGLSMKFITIKPFTNNQ